MTKTIHFVGDVHRHHLKYLELIKPLERTIQIGDVGINYESDLNTLLPWHQFIRGNHDNPDLCKKHKNYLGDWGYLKSDDIFFISGGCSIDRQYQESMGTWYPEEELSYTEFLKVIDKYEKIKPSIVISHECPSFINELLHPDKPMNSVTSNALNTMSSIHEPRTWIFGHHHISYRKTFGMTDFVGLNINEVFHFKY